MARNSIRFNKDGFKKIRRAPGVKAKLERMAKAVADGCNEGVENKGYKTSSVQGAEKPQGRWRTTVITSDAESQKDNAANNTMVRNMNKARDA